MRKDGYLFETHLHTSQTSSCGRDTGADMARAYHKAGYSGIIVTDHFFNGSCAIPKEPPWNQRVELFTAGYLDAKAEGDRIGLTVLFGWEFSAGGSEFLTYGLDAKFLHDNPDLDKMGVKEYIAHISECGGFISQAHPFRERDYLYGIHLYPETEGVEVINAAHKDKEFDKRAFDYASQRNKIMTAGSDLHSKKGVSGAGMIFPAPIETSADFVAALRSGNYKLRP
ncbi:MAG: PHP domain-containing protein [Oscillospiraceae bacterium]|nr:PHP domain-containing protein [Oscillospiraceae bacterium]